jgi:hypothetical protein
MKFTIKDLLWLMFAISIVSIMWVWQNRAQKYDHKVPVQVKEVHVHIDE